jgi:hypothetical protein
MAVWLSASHAGSPITPHPPSERFLVLRSVRGLVEPKATVRLEVLVELLLGMEPANSAL